MRTAVALLVFTLALSAADIVWKPLNEPGSGGAQTSLAVSPSDANRILVGGDMLGVGLSLDQGATWLPTTGFRSWEMAAFTFHPSNPNEVWAGSMSGPYISRDGGLTWSERRAGMLPVRADRYSAPIEKILFDDTDAQHLLAFGGSHRRWGVWVKPEGYGVVWESRDGGESWARLAALPDNPNIVAAAAGPGLRTLYVTADPGGIFRSDDSGATWSPVNNGLPSLNVNYICLHPTDPGTIWAALGNSKDGTQFAPGGIYKSTDGGANWQPSSTGLPQRRNSDTNQSSRFEIVVAAPSNPDRLYTSDTAYSTAGIFRSDDGGATWQTIYNGASMARTPVGYFAGPGMTVAAIDPNNPDAAWFSGTEYILRTLDAGVTWFDATAQPIAEQPGQWSGRGFSGLVAVNLRFNPYQPGEAALIAMDAGKFWKTADDFSTWRWLGTDTANGRPLPRWSGGNDAVFAGPGGATIYATFGQFGEMAGIGRSQDSGRTWTLLGGAARGLPALSTWNGQPTGIWAVPESPNDVWCVVAGLLYASTDGGESWSKNPDLSGLAWLAAHPSEPRILYATGKRGVYRLSNEGQWQLMEGSPADANRIAFDPAQPAVLYVTVSRKTNGGLWRVQDGVWTRIFDNTFASGVDLDPFQPGRIAVSTTDDPYHDYSGATGVWISEDAGATWAQQNQGLAMLRVPVIRFDPHTPGRLIAGTGGRGYFVGLPAAPAP